MDTLKVLTYNMDGKKNCARPSAERLHSKGGLFQIINDSGADVLCLQEVTLDLLKEMKSEPWFDATYRYHTLNYHCSENFLPWFMCIFSRHPISALSVVYRKPHINSRCMLVATMILQSKKLKVCNLYLNASLSGGFERAVEMKFAFDWIGNEDAIVAGGFNFKEGFIPETGSIPESPWIDTWKDIKGGNPGVTWDPTKNGMIHPCPEAHLKAVRSIWGPCRLDRIYYRSKAWGIKEVELIGTKSIEEPDEDDNFDDADYEDEKENKKEEQEAKLSAFPSSHYGLLVCFNAQKIVEGE